MDTTATEAVTGPLGGMWARMTYPSYRPLLSRCGDQDRDAPIARVASNEGRPAGLALARLDAEVPASATLLSLFVDADCRGRGLGTRLLAALESDLAHRGVRRLTGVYMSGKPSVAALERVLGKRGFDPPARRRIAVQFTPEEPAHAPWYRKARLPAGAEVFAWKDLAPAELAALKRSQAEAAWIPPELEPWQVDRQCDPIASVGMRRQGAVVGWIIAQRIAPDFVAFTTSFMRADLARRGAMFSLFVAALKRLEGSGVNCSFVTDERFAAMMTFVERRVAPYVRYVGETMGVAKTLAAPDAPVATAVTRPMDIDASFADRDAWDAFVHASPHGHLFQSWAWGDLQNGLGGRPVRIAALEDGRLRGCVQVLVFESTSRRFTYVPRGPVADPQDRRMVERLVDAALRVSIQSAATLLRIEPQWTFDEDLAQAFDANGFARARQFIMPRRTLLIDLRPSVEAIWTRFRSNTRNRIRLAAARGVAVRTGGPEDLPTFIRLFEETVARHGLRRASVDTFALAERHFGARDDLRLYLASHGGSVLAGIVVFVSGRTATYLWGASSGAEAARRLNPNQLLHWHAMQWAAGRGCSVYDLFGIPDHDVDVLEAEYSRRSGGMWNLYRFKRGFGGSVHRHLGTFDRVIATGLDDHEV